MVWCRCGRVCIVKTSWTDAHPGRRFYSCPIERSRCGWIDWVDPPMCERAVQIIPGLLRARNRHENAIQELTRQVRKMKMYLILSWLGFISIVVMYILA
ncbi:zinc finger, GRF-type [Artemisia annua]|uniref:Zinc finger, GRF-type n=1 Tax=Artemisia annua TaxID=35608 RepID=A0A2U1PBD5_ARTAN|nr:zinc finger, GRF-type [Artemisia annua]